jgi:hypothetical protein
MTESEKAEKVIQALKMAEREPAQTALPILNELVGLVQIGNNRWKSRRRDPAHFWRSAKSEKRCIAESPQMACGPRPSTRRNGGCRL